MNFPSLRPAVFLAVLAITACSDPLRLKATQGTAIDGFVVYAFTGTPASYPTTYVAAARAVSIIDGGGNFDVAFDINAQGKAVIYPMRLVVSPITTFRDVGLLKANGNFATVIRAPNSGYLTDQAIVMNPGEVVVLQTARNSSNDICLYGLSPYIFAKISVDSVVLTDRSIFITTLVNPNCGFHSLSTGVPVD